MPKNVHISILKCLIAKNGNDHLSFQQAVTFCRWRIFHTVRITKMCNTETKWATVVRKIAPTDLLNSGYHKTLICKKKKTIYMKHNKVKYNKMRYGCISLLWAPIPMDHKLGSLLTEIYSLTVQEDRSLKQRCEKSEIKLVLSEDCEKRFCSMPLSQFLVVCWQFLLFLGLQTQHHNFSHLYGILQVSVFKCPLLSGHSHMRLGSTPMLSS